MTMDSERVTSPMAVATVAAGAAAILLSLLLLGLVLGPVALVLGFVALAQIGRSEGRLGGKPLAVVGMVLGGVALLVSVGIAGFVGWGWSAMKSYSENRAAKYERMEANEEAFLKASMVVLGEALAARYAGKTVLVVTVPRDAYTVERTATQVQALMLGCGDAVTVLTQDVAYEDDADAAGRAGEGPYVDFYAVTPGMFDAAVAKHPEADVVVVMGDLPLAFEATRFWSQLGEAGVPPLVLVFAELYLMRDAIASGKVPLALFDDPGASYDLEGGLPPGTQAIFDERYVLITPETVDAVAAAHPGLFKPQPSDAGEGSVPVDAVDAVD